MASPTTYSDEDLTFYRELFAKFDRDNSDSIDPTELGNALRYIGCNPKEREVKVIQHEAEEKVNANRKLEFREFCDIVAKHRKSVDEEKEELMAAFRVFDKNGDGTIDRDELKQVLIDYDMLDDESELDQLFDNTDLDGSGRIDYNELVDIIMAL